MQIGYAVFKCRQCGGTFKREVTNPTIQEPAQFLPIYMQGGGYSQHACYPGVLGIADLIGGEYLTVPSLIGERFEL